MKREQVKHDNLMERLHYLEAENRKLKGNEQMNGGMMGESEPGWDDVWKRLRYLKDEN